MDIESVHIFVLEMFDTNVSILCNIHNISMNMMYPLMSKNWIFWKSESTTRDLPSLPTELYFDVHPETHLNPIIINDLFKTRHATLNLN